MLGYVIICFLIHIFLSYRYLTKYSRYLTIYSLLRLISCSLEPNPRDNSALQQLWIFVVLSAPTNDFSSRSFRASPLSLSLSSPTGCFRFFFPRARFSSRLYVRSLVASLCLHAPSVLWIVRRFNRSSSTFVFLPSLASSRFLFHAF